VNKDDPAEKGAPTEKDTPGYQRAARLLAQKLGLDWRELPTEQVIEYLRKIEIAREKAPKADNKP